jgi:hypothetical protein
VYTAVKEDRMAIDRMQRQRFEFKYIIEESTALAIRDFVDVHLDVDEAGVGKPNYAYRVNSIYLDSDEHTTFWDWVNSNRNRFKLRMRYYDCNPEHPVFLEIKRRVGTCILKQRCAIRRSVAAEILAGRFPAREGLLGQEGKHRAALENFITLTSRLGARPRALVTYLREAYIDPCNEGVRLTLDREVRIAPRSTADFSLDYPRYVQPFGDQVILELKFNNRFPDWFGEMARLYGLTRGAAAKYCEGMSALWRPELGNCLYQDVHKLPLPDSAGPVTDADLPPAAGTPASEPAPTAAQPDYSLALIPVPG